MHEDSTSPDPKPVTVASSHPVIDNNAAKPSSPEFAPGPDLKQAGPDGKASSIVLTFIMGLLAITFIGLIFGATFNDRLVSGHGQYFGELKSGLYLELFVPIATLIFGAFALSLKNIIYWFYPLIAFFVAGMLQEAMATKLLTGYIPVLPPAGNPEYLMKLVAVTLAYILVHSFVWPAQQALKARGMRPGYEKKTFIVSCSLLVLAIMVFGLAGQFSKPLYVAQQRARLAVHIPNSDNLVGHPSNEYTLYQQDSTSHIEAGDVIVKPVPKWWDRDPREVCGNETTNAVYPSQSPANSYQITSDGITYATAIFNANASKPPHPTTAFKEYTYCFVLGYQRYQLIRNDRGANAGYMERYPSSELIDAIAKAPSYILSCLKAQAVYCKTSDANLLRQLDTKANQHSPSLFIPDSQIPSVGAPTANKNAYKAVGRLSIPAWGISFPLSAEIQDAYSFQKTGNEFIIKLHSLDGSKCFNNDGIAFLGRTALSSVQKQTGQTTIIGQTIGSYVYTISDGGLRFCAGQGNISDTQENTIEDVLSWAEANIQ